MQKRERDKNIKSLPEEKPMYAFDDKDKSTCTLLPVIFGALRKRKQGYQKYPAARENRCLLG